MNKTKKTTDTIKKSKEMTEINIPDSIDEKIKIYVPNTNKKNTEEISESDEVKIYTIKK